MTDLWYGTSGPHDAEIVIVGESWGQEEDRLKMPFVGESGKELNRMLAEANIDRNSVLCTNVVPTRPQNNETWRLFTPKDSVPKSTPRIGGLLPGPDVISGVRQLYSQILSHPRRLVIGTGNFALWALSNCSGAEVLRESNGRKIPPELCTYAPNGIMNWRGSMWYVEPHETFLPQGNATEARRTLESTRLLPLIHPAAILRAWYNRAPTVHDLKTRVPMALRSDWRRNPKPIFLSPPTFKEATQRLEHWLNLARAGTVVHLANDVETLRRRFISVMGFSDGLNFAMCIPFVRGDNPDGSIEPYWSIPEEAHLVGLIRQILLHPNIRIMGQNYIYDTQYIQHWMAITPWLDHDTMLAQNVFFPGTPKDLGYLSSLYCDYHWYWKEDAKDWNKVGDLQSLMDYNCEDNIRTWEIGMTQRRLISALKQESQMALKMDTHRLCLRMVNRGVLIDKNRRNSMLFMLEEARHGLGQELLAMVPQDIVGPPTKRQDKTEVMWYQSDSRTKTLFYDILGFNVIKNRKTGRPTSGKEAFPVLTRQNPEFTRLFKRLDEYGSVDNTAGVLKSPCEPDGRMKCSYNPGGTETHRLSSSENVFGRGMNLQNLTKGEEDE